MNGATFFRFMVSPSNMSARSWYAELSSSFLSLALLLDPLSLEQSERKTQRTLKCRDTFQTLFFLFLSSSVHALIIQHAIATSMTYALVQAPYLDLPRKYYWHTAAGLIQCVHHNRYQTPRGDLTGGTYNLSTL